MVSPIRQHTGRLDLREVAAERRRAALPGVAKGDAGGTTTGTDAVHGDAGHRRVGPTRRGEVVQDVRGAGRDVTHDIAKDVTPDIAKDAVGLGADEQAKPGEASQAGELTEQETAEVEKLRQRDAEVRRHEMAHASAGGAHAGAPNYDLERGPDGSMYAVGGHVRIDVSPVAGDPAATLRKMQQVRRAALAPAEPSPQDRRVASRADAEETKARTAIREEQASEGREDAPVQESKDGEALEPAAPTRREAVAASGSSGVSMMTLHAERAYRRSEPPR